MHPYRRNRDQLAGGAECLEVIFGLGAEQDCAALAGLGAKSDLVIVAVMMKAGYQGRYEMASGRLIYGSWSRPGSSDSVRRRPFFATRNRAISVPR